MITTTRTNYRIIGATDDVTDCQCCGRAGLKRTIALIVLDADGNDDTITYYGTACAARAMGRKTTAVRNEADTAQSRINADTAQRAALAAHYSGMTITDAVADYYAVNYAHARWWTGTLADATPAILTRFRECGITTDTERI
jgi:hypothetical protein